jgi:hypothetical protein
MGFTVSKKWPAESRRYTLRHTHGFTARDAARLDAELNIRDAVTTMRIAIGNRSPLSINADDFFMPPNSRFC